LKVIFVIITRRSLHNVCKINSESQSNGSQVYMDIVLSPEGNH
jgi:hypothetical protein